MAQAKNGAMPDLRTLIGLAGPANPLWRRWLALSIAVVLADQVTKMLILARFRTGERLPVIDGLFDLVLAFNPGAAFSFLSSASGWQRYLFVILAIAVSAVLVVFLRKPGGFGLHLGLSLILGGALGNVIDRIHIGEVVDFLLVYHGTWSWPAFNVADSAITIGAGLLILDSFRARHADEPEATKQRDEAT
jgi:signal peptidase II